MAIMFNIEVVQYQSECALGFQLRTAAGAARPEIRNDRELKLNLVCAAVCVRCGPMFRPQCEPLSQPLSQLRRPP